MEQNNSGKIPDVFKSRNTGARTLTILFSSVTTNENGCNNQIYIFSSPVRLAEIWPGKSSLNYRIIGMKDAVV